MDPRRVKKEVVLSTTNYIAMVYLNFGNWDTYVYGSSFEKDYALNTYLYVGFVYSWDINQSWGLRNTTEYYIQTIQPFCGLKLDFFKNNILKRTEYIHFTEYTIYNKYNDIKDIEFINIDYDRVRVRFLHYKELTVENDFADDKLITGNGM